MNTTNNITEVNVWDSSTKINQSLSLQSQGLRLQSQDSTGLSPIYLSIYVHDFTYYTHTEKQCQSMSITLVCT